MHDVQVVGDEQVAQPQLALQVDHEVQDLRLHGHVEGGDRLVGDHQGGRERQRAGQADALPLAAGELVRKPVRVLRPESDQRQQALHLAPHRLALGDLLHDQRLADDLGDPHPRAERREGVLEDDLHLPVVLVHLLAREGAEVQLPAVLPEDDATVGGIVQADDHPPGGGLAAAALPDEPQRLSCRDREVDAVDGPDVADRAPQQPLLDREVLLQARHLQ